MYKKQRHHFEELKPLMALYLQDPVQKGEAASCFRLKELVCRFVEQTTRDKNFSARNKDSSLQGTAAWTVNPKVNLKCIAQETVRLVSHI